MSFIATQKFYLFSMYKEQWFPSQTVISTLQILTLHWYTCFSFHWSSKTKQLPCTFKVTSTSLATSIPYLVFPFVMVVKLSTLLSWGKPLYIHTGSHLCKDVTPAMDPFQLYCQPSHLSWTIIIIIPKCCNISYPEHWWNLFQPVVD